ncbi:carboxypeptidase-like regulatory domain-containing protein [Portibacter marinus]|uniref:carboxypeptidase-like regulatory domain-containing protein n=1 Tax=Portibacter marinus TaxID=2898660 RepID=UPI001F1BED46|nr:carboxypeptidase-like regulatory domain-containing protein [Portibacter marinus]
MSGRVKDFGTGEPIENVRIYVQDGFTGSGPILNHDDIGEKEALTYSDENGEFSVEIKAENNPVLYPSKSSEYWNYNEGGLVQSGEIFTKGGGHNNIEIVLKGKAYLNFRAETINGQADSIQYLGFVDYPNVHERELEKGQTFNRKETFAIGNKYFVYDFSYKRDGVWTSILDSIYIPLGETRGDTIYY